jgi:hypothetical protein
MRREFHITTLSRLPLLCCLASILMVALACARPNTSAGNENARNANASQPAATVTTPESATNGQIEVTSTPPGAMIILIEITDGATGAPQVKGSTPATISVRPGTYAVALEKTGSKPFQKEVKVEANKTTKVNARLR